MVKICPNDNCQKENLDDAIFCEECGFDLGSVEGSITNSSGSITPNKPTLASRLLVSKFRDKTLTGEIVLDQDENIIGREDIVDATNNSLDEGDYLYISRKVNGGHAKIFSKSGSQSFSIEHISQRDGVKTTVNGNSIEGMGEQPIKDGDIIILNSVFEFIFKVN